MPIMFRLRGWQVWLKPLKRDVVVRLCDALEGEGLKWENKVWRSPAANLTRIRSCALLGMWGPRLIVPDRLSAPGLHFLVRYFRLPLESVLKVYIFLLLYDDYHIPLRRQIHLFFWVHQLSLELRGGYGSPESFQIGSIQMLRSINDGYRSRVPV